MTGSVCVVGGGVAGLSVAWELTKRGRRVALYEANKIGSGASAVATSYLEPRLGTTPSRKIEWASLALWPGFAADLQRHTGIDVGYRPNGQWRYAFADDEAEVHADFETRREAGWNVSWITGTELRDRAPAVTPEVTAAAIIRDPAWVDGPAICAALAKAIAATPGCAVNENTRVAPSDLASEAIVVVASANGAFPGPPHTRVTKGTTLFYSGRFDLDRMLRHKSLSVVPRPGGLVVGSSRERGATSLEPDPEVVADLHRRAVRVLPTLAGRTPQPRCGFRTLVGDGALNLGRNDDLIWSLSHAGVGYLRAPLVAKELAAIIDGEEPGLVAPFFKR